METTEDKKRPLTPEGKFYTENGFRYKTVQNFNFINILFFFGFFKAERTKERNFIQLQSQSLLQRRLKTPCKVQVANFYNRDRIGNRDWVAFGLNGRAEYLDHLLYPFPSIRFKENTNELLALREKEKGDWRKLSIEEKKTLYRASFRQTFAEITAPTGRWKSIVGGSLILISLGLWIFIIEKNFIYPPKPKTFSDDWRAATLRRKIDLQMGHISGIAAHWDYEKDDWK